LVATTSEAEAVATKFNLHAFLREKRPLLGLNPGAEYGPAKRWPVERFAAAALDIHARTGAVWLIVGGPADVTLAGSLEGAFRQANAPSALKNLCGQTTLRDLMALLTRCRLLLTNDTGPMHVAAALGTPVVALFGSTAPELTCPGLPDEPSHHLVRVQSPCAPCFRRSCPIDFRCMTGIQVERVVEEIAQILASQPPSSIGI
jgi:heptosyltransferase-2